MSGILSFRASRFARVVVAPMTLVSVLFACTGYKYTPLTRPYPDAVALAPASQEGKILRVTTHSGPMFLLRMVSFPRPDSLIGVTGFERAFERPGPPDTVAVAWADIDRIELRQVSGGGLMWLILAGAAVPLAFWVAVCATGGGEQMMPCP